MERGKKKHEKDLRGKTIKKSRQKTEGVDLENKEAAKLLCSIPISMGGSS